MVPGVSHLVCASVLVAGGAATPYGWLERYDPATSLEKRIDPPPGFSRAPAGEGSFAAFLRGLPLKAGRPAVHLHDGRLKGNQEAHFAVVDIDVGRRDLQQCADAVMRLYAEYLFSRKDFERIRFNYVSGFAARYTRWREGFRPKVEGNRVREVQTRKPDPSWRSFRAYLDSVFMYANSHSLERQMTSVPVAEMRIGDVFVQGGFPGHAVIVADMAGDGSGKKVFLLLQSYMPAQEIHVLRNPGGEGPWYPLDFGEVLETPEWRFTKDDLRRFW